MLDLQKTPAVGTTLRVLGTPVTYRLTARETEGGYFLFESAVPAGEGMLPHRHPLESVLLYLLEGRLTFRLEDAVFVLEAGQTVFVPRGAVHAFQNTGSAPARLLTLASPGYLHEGFFAEVGVAVDAPKTALELEKITQTAAKYQIEILPLT